MERLLAPLVEGVWWQGLDAIKITGSNGKGTVAMLTEAILRQLGLVTGLYTSPHLRRFGERFRIFGRPAEAFRLTAAMDRLRPRLHALGDEGDSPLAFEGMTVLALELFERLRVEAAVLEAGIGGRHDATRLVPGRIAVLVSVDLEHTELLGASEEEIALDKADLSEDGGVLIVGRLEPGLVRQVRRRVEARGVEVVELGRVASWGRPRPFDGGVELDLEIDGMALEGLRLGLHGEHHAESAALAAVTAWRWLRGRKQHPASSARGPAAAPENGSGIDSGAFDKAARTAFSKCELEGRFERISANPEVWIDIGHTTAAARFTARAAEERFAGRPVFLVLGISQDREPSRIVPPLVAVADHVIVTRALHRGGEPERVVDAIAQCSRSSPARIETVLPLDAAVERALRRAQKEGAVVLVAGGLFLAIEAAEIVAGRDPRELRFY
ncbi:MAG: hypothetical protein MI919_02025 [Holophagales bacterium]|nr:hypothetical protein [Holophagales bacterium]